MNKTTKKDYQRFVYWCEVWQKKLGLIAWCLRFAHRQARGSRATVHVTPQRSLATVTLATQWDCEVTDDQLRSVALHEMCHVLLGQLVHVAESRCIGIGNIETEEERVVCALTSIIEKLETQS